MLASLFHLVYQSFPTTALAQPELAALLRQSRAWNTAHGLTGVLLYGDTGIMQVLEGPENEVRAIFARISLDSRHRQLVKLSEGPVAQRYFSQWSMGFKLLNPADSLPLSGYLDLGQPAAVVATGVPDAGLHAVLAAFVGASDDDIRF